MHADDAEARRMLETALEAGIDPIDTANGYSEGRSEELLGQWLRGKRHSVTLATKCRFPTLGGTAPMHPRTAACRSRRRCARSTTLIRAGKVRYAGCSNYTGYRLTEALWAADRRGHPRYEGIQLQWSLTARDAERELIPAARACGLGLVWSPLGRGFLTGKYRKGQPPPPGTRLEAWKDSWAMTATEQNWRTLDKVLEIAGHHDTKPASVALA